MTDPVLLVITASTRQGRVGPEITSWLTGLDHGSWGFRLACADLRDDGPPMLASAGHPGRQEYDDEAVWRWSRTVNEADAIVVVSPEYDYSMPASLLNALQCLYLEWGFKPLGLVTYGGQSGGLRAAQTIRTVASTLLMFVTESGLAIRDVSDRMVGGAFQPTAREEETIDLMIAELRDVSDALAGLRSARRSGIAAGPR